MRSRKKQKNIIPIVLVILIFVSAGGLVKNFYDKYQAEKRYERIAQEVTGQTELSEEQSLKEPESVEETETEENNYQSQVDFEALWNINSQVVGWIKIPGTEVDYPILHDPEDNEKYLHTDLEGNDSQVGAIYLDCDDKGDFSSKHNVIYGHHMKNGSMFKDIVKYKDSSYWKEHSEIDLYLPDREIKLKPFACLYTTPDGKRRKTRFSEENAFQSYITEMTRDAVVYEEPDQKVGKLYSLITCSYEFQDARTILYCYEVEDNME